MADNQQTTNSPAAAQASATPAQPSTTRQPAGQTAQGTAAPYAQYPNAYGQTYHSYQQYGYNPYGGAYGQGMYPQAGPQSPVPEGKLWIYTKTGLHGLAVVVAICSLGMGLSLIPGENGYLARIACPLPGIALIWSGAELIVRAVHKFQIGIHPGGQVAACLILWLAAAIVGAAQQLYGTTSTGESCETRYHHNTEYYSKEECHDRWSGGKRRVWMAIASFTCILCLIYFILFVGACVDTSKHNSARRRLVMVVNPGTYWGPPAQGWQPMPQQSSIPAQQQGQYMSVPQQAMTRDEQGQDIPLQNRMPSPMTSHGTPNEKGQGPEQAGTSQQQGNHGIQEFYTPGGANN